MLNIWVGWDKTYGMTMEQVVRNIKAINPDSRVFLYENSMEVDDDNAADGVRVQQGRPDEVVGLPARRHRPPCSRPSAGSVEAQYHVNNTLFTPRDSSGYQQWEWHARWVVQQFYKPNPSIDGFFEDNVFWRPRVDADWNRDGVTDSKDSPQAGKWLREGYRKRFQLFDSLMPGKLMIGNIADWGIVERGAHRARPDAERRPHRRHHRRALLVETWASWAEMMRWYRKTMAAVAEPKLVAFHQIGSADRLQGAALRPGVVPARRRLFRLHRRRPRATAASPGSTNTMPSSARP